MKPSQPIKRHSSLVEFSRDHHDGLLLVWKIRKELKAGADGAKVADDVLFFFRNFLLDHFRDEEKFLFPLLPVENELRKQAEADHEKIYGLILLIENVKGDKHLLSHFADLLEKHIRFEERRLFELMQQIVEPGLLAGMNEKTHRHRAENKFWIKNDHENKC